MKYYNNILYELPLKWPSISINTSVVLSFSLYSVPVYEGTFIVKILKHNIVTVSKKDK